MAATAEASQFICQGAPSSPMAAARESFSIAAPDTLPANEAAAVLAEKYAALVQLLRSTSGELPDDLPQQLQQNLQACLAAWPSQSGMPRHQAAEPDTCQSEQQQQQQHSQLPPPVGAPRRVSSASDTAEAAPAAHSAGGGPQCNHSNNSSNVNRDSQLQEKHHQQHQQEVLDSPESHQTQIAGAFTDYNIAATATRITANQLANQQQQLHGGAPSWTACSIGADHQHDSPPQPAAAPVASTALHSPASTLAAACVGSSALPQHYVTAIKSSYRGLTWDRKDQRWRVRVHFMGKQHHVGRFTDEVQAAKHFDSSAYFLFGDKAITNFGIEATKANNGHVPASIRALLHNSTQGSSLTQPRGGSAAPGHGGGFGTKMPPPGSAGRAVAYPSAAIAGRGAAGGISSSAAAAAGSTDDSIAYQQPQQFRQLPVLLAAGNASASGPVGPSSPTAAAAAAARVSRQRQVAYPWNASKKLMLPQQYHPPQQQLQHGRGVSAQHMNSTMAGTPDWLNKQVRRMGDLRPPAAAARTSDTTTATVATTAAAAAAAGTTQQQPMVLEQAVQARSLRPLQQQQQQQQRTCTLFGDPADVNMIDLEEQLSYELLHLQQQLQRRFQGGSQQASVLPGHALDRKFELMQQLHHNIQELQQVLDDEEQQQQQFEQPRHLEQDLGAAAGADGPTFSAGDVSAFLTTLLALPGLVKSTTSPIIKAKGSTLVGQKRKTSEPETMTKPPPLAAAAADAAAGSGVLADPATQETTEALSALAAMITALQQAGDDGTVSGGKVPAGREHSAEPASPNDMSQEVFAAFFPCKQ